MTSDGQSVERLRDYLRTLKPEARAMLVTELERGMLRGDEAAGNEFVLQELRRTIRAAGQAVLRTVTPPACSSRRSSRSSLTMGPTTSGSAGSRACRSNRSGNGFAGT